MEHDYRSHRRRTKARRAARLVIAGGAAGIVGVIAIAMLTVVLRNHLGAGAGKRETAASSSASAGLGLIGLRTGDKLSLTTPDGFTYDVAGVKAATSDHPLSTSRTPPPAGATLAYADYVITNTGTQPALLDFPADLFVRRSKLPPSVRAANRCMPQPGAPADMCTLPDHTDVVNTLGFAPPTSSDGDQYIPAGATYLLRVATDMGVSEGAGPGDLGLYVWNPRFVPDRKAVKVPLP